MFSTISKVFKTGVIRVTSLANNTIEVLILNMNDIMTYIVWNAGKI